MLRKEKILGNKEWFDCKRKQLISEYVVALKYLRLGYIVTQLSHGAFGFDLLAHRLDNNENIVDNVVIEVKWGKNKLSKLQKVTQSKYPIYYKNKSNQLQEIVYVVERYKEEL